MIEKLRYVAFKAARDFLVAGLGTAAIAYVAREFAGTDPYDLPVFVAVLAVWRVARGRLLLLLVDDMTDAGDVARIGAFTIEAEVHSD